MRKIILLGIAAATAIFAHYSQGADVASWDPGFNGGFTPCPSRPAPCLHSDPSGLFCAADAPEELQFHHLALGTQRPEALAGLRADWFSGGLGGRGANFRVSAGKFLKFSQTGRPVRGDTMG